MRNRTEAGVSNQADGVSGPMHGVQLVSRIGQAADLPFPAHPHMLRHACGFKLTSDDPASHLHRRSGPTKSRDA